MNRYFTMFGWRSLLTVALIAVAFSGCNKKPVADFTMSASEGPAPLSVTFTDASVAKKGTITAWLWDFADGATSDQQNPAHVFQQEGVYEVSLTVTDSRDQTGQKTSTVTVAAPDDTAEGETEGETDEGESEEGETEAEEGEEEGEVEALPEIALMGWTRTVDGHILPGVEVTVIDTGAVATTEGNGLYCFYDEAAITGDAVVVKFTKQGYAATSVLVDVVAGRKTVANATLKQLADPVTLDASGGGDASDGDGNRLTVPADAFVRRDTGQPISGNIKVHITPLDVTNTADMAAFPGEFLAIPAGAKADETVRLETFALADFTATQDGVDLDLSPTKADDAFIELVLPATTSLTAGEQVPLWHFDEEAGVWKEEGVGEVTANKAGALVYRASIQHLSWWNADRPVSDTHCFTGTALDEDGNPLPYARVQSEGVDYSGSSYATADANGEFCIDIKRNSTVVLNLYLPGGTMIMDSTQVTAPDVAAQCSSGGCTPLPEPLQANLDGCLSGQVVDEYGRALADAQVYSSLGATAITDSLGNFCMNTPADAYATVFVAGRPPASTWTSSAGASCDTGGCAQVLINVDYPDDGDVVGSLNTYGNINQNNTYVSANASFTLMNEGDGNIEPIPEFGCLFIDPEAFEQEGEWQEEGEWEEEGEWVTEPEVGLDPGAPGLLTNGTDTAELPRSSDLYPGENALQYGTFNLMYEDSQLFAPGDTLTYSWPGGMDIGAFDATTTLPTVPAVVYPDLDMTSPDYMDFPLDAAVDVQWTPTGSDYVTIYLNVWVQNPATPEVYGQGMISCTVEDDGAHTIPADLMQRLPSFTDADIVSVNFNIHFVVRDIVQVPLTQGGLGTVYVNSQGYETGSKYQEPAR